MNDDVVATVAMVFGTSDEQNNLKIAEFTGKFFGKRFVLLVHLKIIQSESDRQSHKIRKGETVFLQVLVT